MNKDAHGSQEENYGKDHAAGTINRYRQPIPLLIFQYRRHQHFNERKEDKHGAHQNEGIEVGCVREARQLVIDGESISNKSKHRSDCDADLGVGGDRVDPENGPRHNYNENKWEDHFPNVVLRVARSSEFESVT